MGVTRYGRREWLTATIIAGVLVAIFAWLSWWWAVAVVLVPWLAVLAFFRDPPRRVPTDLPPQTMVSPADGCVSAVEETSHHDAVDGAALIIRIFLSVLDVHVNRSPCDGVVLATTHTSRVDRRLDASDPPVSRAAIRKPRNRPQRRRTAIAGLLGRRPGTVAGDV